MAKWHDWFFTDCRGPCFWGWPWRPPRSKGGCWPCWTSTSQAGPCSGSRHTSPDGTRERNL